MGFYFVFLFVFVNIVLVCSSLDGLLKFGLVCSSLVWFAQVWFGWVEFGLVCLMELDLVWLFHRSPFLDELEHIEQQFYQFFKKSANLSWIGQTPLIG